MSLLPILSSLEVEENKRRVRIRRKTAVENNYRAEWRENENFSNSCSPPFSVHPHFLFSPVFFSTHIHCLVNSHFPLSPILNSIPFSTQPHLLLDPRFLYSPRFLPKFPQPTYLSEFRVADSIHEGVVARGRLCKQSRQHGDQWRDVFMVSSHALRRRKKKKALI